MPADPISGWFLNKGIATVTDFLTNGVKQVFDIESPEEIIINATKNIDDKLYRIMKAPYKQAITHLREGEIEKAKDCLVHAIALNGFDILARLLYISILCYYKKHKLALEYYWELYMDFTFRKDLFPEVIYNAFINITEQTAIILQNNLNVRYGFGASDEKYFPRSASFFLPYFCVTWESKRRIMGISYKKEAINSFDWRGKELFSRKGCDPAVVFLSYNYIVYKVNNKYYLFSLKSSQETLLTDPEITSIFEVKDNILFSEYNVSNKEIVLGTQKKGNLFMRQGDTLKGSYECTHYSLSSDNTYESTEYYKYGTLDIIKTQ